MANFNLKKELKRLDRLAERYKFNPENSALPKEEIDKINVRRRFLFDDTIDYYKIDPPKYTAPKEDNELLSFFDEKAYYDPI